jgi:hypothetical protein
MKIVTKNYSLKNGQRSYLVYLKDHNNNSLECYDVCGEKDRLKKEEEISERFNIDEGNMKYITLEDFKSEEDPTDSPLILVFYLDRGSFANSELVHTYGENVKRYLEEKGDNVRLFFMPTDGEEKINCINPVYIENKEEFKKLNELIENLSNQFQLNKDITV